MIKLMRGGILPVILSVLLFSCETFTEALASISTSLSSLSSSDSGTAGRSDPGRRADPDAANWDIDALDTARDAEYLTGLEKDVVL